MDDDHLEPVGRFAWERIVRATDTTATVKLVALMLATYGDRNGAHLRPGVDRLSTACGLSDRATRAALGTLRDLGLIERTAIGKSTGRKAVTDEHRLTRPGEVPADGAGTATGEATDNPTGVPAGGAGTEATSTGTSRHEYRHLTTEVPAPDDRSTGTTCTPSSTDHVYTKSSSSRSDDDLAQKIADEKNWDHPHARRVVTTILDRANGHVTSPQRYVLESVRRDPNQYRPAVTFGHGPPPGIPPHEFDPDPDDDGLTCAACATPRLNRAHSTADSTERPVSAT